jgi:undecaprenyl-diphosphatase
MNEWIRSLVLGVVQGITEFLPISSDGHLALLQILTSGSGGASSTGEPDHLFFDVMLHVGTAAAIVFAFRKQVAAGARGLLGDPDVPELYTRPALMRLAKLVFVALLPLVPIALGLNDLIEETFQSLYAVGFGFLVTAAVLLLTLVLPGGHKGPREMTWLDALIIGVAQAFAPLPGVSRSGLTIGAALMRGFSKSWAVGFSLLLAVPAIGGATVFELRKLGRMGLSADRVAQIVAASALAGVVGYAAIVWLVRIVRAGRLWYFSVYLVILAAIILGILAPRRARPGGPDARAHALDRPAALAPPRPTAGLGRGRAGRADLVDRPRRTRPRADSMAAGDPRGRAARCVRLHLA